MKYQSSSINCSKEKLARLQFSKNRSNAGDKVTRSKLLAPILYKILMWNIKALALSVQKLIARLKFYKYSSNSKFNVTGSKMVVTTERYTTRNIYVEYQRSSTHCSIVISKVKVFKNRSNSKVKVTWSKLMVPMERSCLIEGHMVKNNATNGKVSKQGILMWNIECLALTVR